MMDPARIKELIEAAIPDCSARVEDDAGDGQHFSAQVVSPAFEGLSLIRQHQLVYKALKGKMGNELHALALTTSAPPAS